MSFQDQVVLITGGAGGIGSATALKLAAEGAKIVIFDRERTHSEKLMEQIKALKADCIYEQVDVTDKSRVKKCIDDVIAAFGRLDVLINNAGILQDNLIENLTEEEWDNVIDVNLKGSFICSKVAQEVMKKQQYGKIVMVSSLAVGGAKGRANYAAAKAGILGLMRTLAIELGPFNINVNAVAPGYIETEMSDVSEAMAKQRGVTNFGMFKQNFIKNNPIQRIGTPEDVANVIAFLASKDSDYVTGQTIFVSGSPSLS